MWSASEHAAGRSADTYVASVIAGGADRERSTRAMASVDRLLIDHAANIAPLFTPPFDRSPAEPGYIKAYPRGVRESGGLYTHGAIWSMARGARRW